MAGVNAFNPIWRFADVFGAPLAKGLVYVCLDGTDTLTPSWHDQAQTTLNDNPIKLDAFGQATIWLDPSITYRFKVCDLNGNFQYAIPSISGASGNIGFVQTGTGAVARTLQSKVRDIVSWKDFGAIGDGSSHPLSGTYSSLAAAQAKYPFVTSLSQETDWAAIQACINALSTVGGGFAYGPPGTYMLGTDSLAMAVGVVPCGSGKYTTLVKYSGTGNTMKMSNQINSSAAAKNGLRDLGVIMTNASATGGCYVDVGGTFVDIVQAQLVGGKFGVIFDQTELGTIRQCDIEAQVANGAGVWLVNGGDFTPAVTFTVAPVAGATSGTLNASWTGVTGTFNLDFTETVGGAHEQRTATLTNGSTAVTWTGGLSANCNASTNGGSSQFTNRLLITENQFNNGAAAASHIIDDGGVSHQITYNNFNSGLVNGPPSMCRFAGVLSLEFEGNEMEGGNTMLQFTFTTNYSGTGTGTNVNVNVIGNEFSMSQLHASITIDSGSSPFVLIGNWFGSNSTTKVTGIGNCSTCVALGNFYSNNLFDGVPPHFLQIDNGGSFCNGLLSLGSPLGYAGGQGAGGAVTQATSKSTAVTLNKACGQITMNNASLAAGTSVSFTWNNTLIAATDFPSVVIGSGASADSYRVDVTAVASGSCRIQVENRSAGALGEALVLNVNLNKGVIN